jgi:hypothetical protein
MRAEKCATKSSDRIAAKMAYNRISSSALAPESGSGPVANGVAAARRRVGRVGRAPGAAGAFDGREVPDVGQSLLAASAPWPLGPRGARISLSAPLHQRMKLAR